MNPLLKKYYDRIKKRFGRKKPETIESIYYDLERETESFLEQVRRNVPDEKLKAQ